jgi:NSS family neurotransmitter:Na+ symporter
MGEPTKQGRGGFGTDLGFILAAAGSAVGLGNIWKFPYITGEYGGGAFVLVYLVCIAVVGLPLMYAEMILGKRGGKDVLGALRNLTSKSGRAEGGVGDLVVVTGIMAVASGFLILSFYSVVAGWAIHFFWISLDLIPMGEGGAVEAFGKVAGSPLLSMTWHTVFMLLTASVVAGGVHNGIERLCKRLMPTLIVILLGLLVYCAFAMDLGKSLSFLFRPDFSKLTGDAVIEALGHAFFTLSLGMGAMMTYGSYLKKERHIIRDGVWVAVLDTGIALLAGTVIFAVVFHYGVAPSAGPGLLFKTLPDLFAQMPGGILIASAFFLLVIFAAWSSAISLLEVVVAYFVDEHRWSRKTAAWALGGTIWLIGLASARWGVVLDFLDNLTTRYMLPTGGLLIAIIAGWLITREDREAGFMALPGGGHLWARCWTFTIRYVTPIAVTLVILAKMNILKF